MHNLTSLTKGLQEAGIRTHLETSGAHPLTGSFDFITLSPKKFKSALDEFYAVAHELKVIVYNKHDLKWAESHVQKLNDSAARYLQPEWDVREESVPMILNYVRNNPHWKISLQSHKYIGIP